MTGPEQLMIEAATGIRTLTSAELRQIREHIAQAGFNPEPNARPWGLAGMAWRGRRLAGSDRLSPGEVHYLDHVIKLREWPDDTTLQEYYDSIRRTILDPRSEVMTSRFGTRWQVTIVGPSGAARGPRGASVILVDYRIGTGFWMTAFQPNDLRKIVEDPRRTDMKLWPA